MKQLQAYAFKSDILLDHKGPICVMDAHCALCSRGAHWIASNDRKFEFRIIPLQSEIGRDLLRFYDLDPFDPTSWLLLDRGLPLIASDAILRTGQLLGGKWRAIGLLRVFPKGMRDWVYRLVARNRIRWFGQADMCAMPDAELAKRLIT